jgi:hypothetical protein
VIRSFTSSGDRKLIAGLTEKRQANPDTAGASGEPIADLTPLGAPSAHIAKGVLGIPVPGILTENRKTLLR